MHDRSILFAAEHMCYSNVARHELHGDVDTVRLRCSEMWFHTLVCNAIWQTCSVHGRSETVLKSDTALPNLSELAGKPHKVLWWTGTITKLAIPIYLPNYTVSHHRRPQYLP